jgi:hypothetical protein
MWVDSNELGIVRVWYDVDNFLPGSDDFVPVRCINSDAGSEFYFMAIFRKGEWEFFADECNDEMQVTHWCKAIKLNDDGRYNKKENGMYQKS